MVLALSSKPFAGQQHDKKPDRYHRGCIGKGMEQLDSVIPHPSAAPKGSQGRQDLFPAGRGLHRRGILPESGTGLVPVRLFQRTDGHSERPGAVGVKPGGRWNL